MTVRIEETQESDFVQVVDLVKRVVDKNILPHFSNEGQVLFSSKVRSDVETTFDKSKFQNLKLIENNKVIGFAALRENNCITHLFIDTNFQNKGLGKLLLNKLLSLTESSEVRLRASVNAQNFYQSQGFVATEGEQNIDGVRFVPMRLVRT
ncbi:GNAT family N-acetyltransferase [Vibrio alginolyticus]|uniref:GNAT family N-acetyltransferase n=1 Tax=Vibrio harveyi group TaxID=717610 RepID=UPI002022BFC1|nr:MULTISPECIES: GNAT family N-acetyltransferase [Vibrio harveyi group]